jgi:hypothetical protein
MISSIAQPALIALTCPACGAKLRVSSGAHTCACPSCGSEFTVECWGDAVSLQPVTEGLSDILAQNQRIANELAIARLEEEIAASGAKNQQLVTQLEQDLATVGKDPGSHLYLAAVSMALVGFFFLVTGNSSNLGFGLFMILAGLGLFFFGVWRATKLIDERNALLEYCRQQVHAMETTINDSEAQIDALRRSRA